MALQTLILILKLAALPLAKPLLQEEELPASGDEQRMDRESQPPKVLKFFKQEFSSFPPNLSCPNCTQAVTWV